MKKAFRKKQAHKILYKQAMIAMDRTIAGAASGETAGIPRRRRVHNLRQKDRRVLSNLFVMLIFRITKLIYYSYDHEIGAHPISFLFVKLV